MRRTGGASTHSILRRKVDLNNDQLSFKWQVSADTCHGFPDSFDRKVFKIIESLAQEQGRPLKNPIHFSLYRILQILDLPPFGVHFARVRSSVQRIAALKVHTHLTRSAGENADVQSETFHLYDDVMFQEEAFGNDIGAGNHQLNFGEWYLESLNQGSIQPIDLEMLTSVPDPVSSRLGELLSVQFLTTRIDLEAGWRIAYTDLCALMPQKQLDGVHNDLIGAGYLEDAQR